MSEFPSTNTVVIATHDYNIDMNGSNVQFSTTSIQNQLLAFRRGSYIRIHSNTNNGWSYGSIITDDKPASHKYNDLKFGWFPTSYVVPVSTPTQIPSTIQRVQWNDNYSYIEDQRQDIERNPNILQQQSQAQQPELTESILGVTVSSSIPTEYENDNDEGFFGTPMGGYIEPHEEDASNDDQQRQESNDDTLPKGVVTIMVPDRRNRFNRPKNLISSIANTTTKTTSHVVQLVRHKKNPSTVSYTKPSVHVSP